MIAEFLTSIGWFGWLLVAVLIGWGVQLLCRTGSATETEAPQPLGQPPSYHGPGAEG